MNLTLILTIFLFGASAFFRKLAVDRIDPYQLQIVAAAIYAGMIPVWLYFLDKQQSVVWDLKGIIFGCICLVSYIVAAVLFGFLLKQSSDPGMMATLVAMNPAVTMMLTATILGEELGPRKLIASALMFAGFYLFN
jgi:drug/metabolite transporter (DMT)-like permease